ncbi:DNA-3-methyladenine glycosylase family protein [Alkanindiges sp. WGS2144]|uniref:DNA-3-methyladenine glycosylase family protein n=1 Tax=Alkanindiges sp. WGS2144 TaxID=3366808 RepID=UPI003750407E
MLQATIINPVRQQAYEQAAQHLASIDEDWQGLITQVGLCQLEVHPAQEPFMALIRNVAYQQLHGKAAKAIFERFLALYDDEFPDAGQILQTDPMIIRACGFSARKLDYILGIAQAQQQGHIPDWGTAQQMSNEQLIEQLVRLKGVGQWTVEMFLIFNLGRLDVWPIDDYAVQQNYRLLKGLEQPLLRKHLKAVGEQLAPYQSIAAWYLWRLSELGR